MHWLENLNGFHLYNKLMVQFTSSRCLGQWPSNGIIYLVFTTITVLVNDSVDGGRSRCVGSVAGGELVIILNSYMKVRYLLWCMHTHGAYSIGEDLGLSYVLILSK